jgi:hypothetical protein
MQVASFVSGGALPPARRGQTETGLVHICDWLGTFAALAGAKAFDFKAHANGLPPVDSHNHWYDCCVFGAITICCRCRAIHGHSSMVDNMMPLVVVPAGQ